MWANKDARYVLLWCCCCGCHSHIMRLSTLLLLLMMMMVNYNIAAVDHRAEVSVSNNIAAREVEKNERLRCREHVLIYGWSVSQKHTKTIDVTRRRALPTNVCSECCKWSACGRFFVSRVSSKRVDSISTRVNYGVKNINYKDRGCMTSMNKLFRLWARTTQRDRKHNGFRYDANLSSGV